MFRDALDFLSLGEMPDDVRLMLRSNAGLMCTFAISQAVGEVALGHPKLLKRMSVLELVDVSDLVGWLVIQPIVWLLRRHETLCARRRNPPREPCCRRRRCCCDSSSTKNYIRFFQIVKEMCGPRGEPAFMEAVVDKLTASEKTVKSGSGDNGTRVIDLVTPLFKKY